MNKVLFINSVFGYGSTGKIVLNLAKEYEQDEYEVKIAYGRNDKISDSDTDELDRYGVRIGNDMDVYFHVLYTRITDKHGLASKIATRTFIKWAEEYDPDLLWIHNIHGYFINYELLFHWIKSRPQMQVKWTLHDCWAFTGHCSHFTYIGCDKWKCTGCCNCPQRDQYPETLKDNSGDNFARKKAAFTGLPNLSIITPSNWLKDKVKESFLSDYPVEVKYNTINTDIFKPTPSTFKQDYGIQDKWMILGVASIWNERKGLNDFIELSHKLNPELFKVVLVGLSREQIKQLSQNHINILMLPRTSSALELAKLYTAADVFVNPSYEETYGLTVAEAQATGTYTLVYKETACEEILNKACGKAVKMGDVSLMANIINERMGN